MNREAAVFGAFFLGAAIAGSPVTGAEGTSMTADQALQKLMAGNQNFVSSRLTLQKQSTAAVRQALANGQKPYAVILSCSDSRVPPEIIFDKGLGEIFVIRVAGNVATPTQIGSVEYAVEHLGSPLIVVLGHTRCGAVTAAVQAKGDPGPNLGAVVEAIGPAVAKARQECGNTKDEGVLIECAADANARLVAASLQSQSKAIATLVREGKVRIVAAKYDLDTGKVSLLE